MFDIHLVLFAYLTLVGGQGFGKFKNESFFVYSILRAYICRNMCPETLDILNYKTTFLTQREIRIYLIYSVGR